LGHQSTDSINQAEAAQGGAPHAEGGRAGHRPEDGQWKSEDGGGHHGA
jgi:hypothetical protein